MEGLSLGVAVTAFGWGLRHGVDWDHIAAIADLSGSEPRRRRALVLASAYAIGHALVVLALGLVAILAGDRLPASLDDVMARVVGATLVVLGAVVLVTLAREGRDFRLRSRWMILIEAGRRRLGRREVPGIVVIEHDHPHADHEPHHHSGDVATLELGARGDPARLAPRGGREHRHPHVHHVEMPADPFAGYGPATAFAVGVLHGVGAETPTQILVLAAAAGTGGTAGGIAYLVAFVVGLLVANSAVAALAALGLVDLDRRFPVVVVLTVVVGGASVALGALMLTGNVATLPRLLA